VKRVFLSSFALLLFSVTSAFAWGDLCEDAKGTPLMTKVASEEFFKDNLQGNSYSGKGKVRDVRSYGGNEYFVVVDCLNDVWINVVTSSSSAKDLKIGEEVRFSGKCAHTFRRTYRDTHMTYQIFELQGGDIK
jgi:hypothetical protein